MLQIRDLYASYDGAPVLRGVDLALDRGEIVCLTGPNGAGKSTLLRCAAGRQQPDSGRVVLERNASRAYLGHDEPPSDGGTVLERLWRARGELGRTRARALGGDLAAIDVFERAGGYELEARTAARARDLGVEALLERPAAQLSTGQRRKLDLAGALAAEADLLVLDEPLDHLDLPGIAAVEDALAEAARRGGGVLLVSHDRELVDRLADRTAHLERGRLFAVEGGYSAALRHRSREHEARRHRAENLRRQLRALEADARRRAGWATRTEAKKRGAGAAKPVIAKRARKLMKRAKAVERRSEQRRQELERTRPWVEKPVHLAFPTYTVPRRVAIRLEGVTLERGGRRILDGIDLAVSTRERVALIGGNGEGKTSLLRAAAGELPVAAGRVQRHPTASVGVVPQGLEGFFAHETLLPNLMDLGHEEAQVRQFLGAARLRRESALQPVDRLSAGERMRCALVRLVLQRCELLLLDEPTTHLDLESLEVLEEMLDAFPGGFLVVSHDRRFVANTCERILVLESGRLREP